jgi:hypothetical protein
MYRFVGGSEMQKRLSGRVHHRIAIVTATLALTLVGLPATARADVTTLPAYGLITISDPGTGPRATWTYDGSFDCTFSTSGPGGAPSSAIVTCTPSQSLRGTIAFNCPGMILSRATATVVGARASCDSTLDIGIGTSAVADANLGPVDFAIICEAYNVGVLVPPYSVTCNEPAVPTGVSSLIPVPTG